MGDIAEYHMDIAMEQDARMEADRHFERQKVERMEKEYSYGILEWETQFDGFIMLTKMTAHHLENTIGMLKQKEKNEVRKTWIKLMGYELKKRK